MAIKMPERMPADGPVNVSKVGEGSICITVTTGGETQSITMGDFNAWRTFGMLALMLGIPLPPSIGKAIKF